MEQDTLADACRSWTPKGLALFYELIFSDLGWKFPAHLFPVALGICDTRINKLMLIIGPGSGKSQFLSITVPAWIVGHDPNTTALGISGGEALMQGFATPHWLRAAAWLVTLVVIGLNATLLIGML